MFGCQEFKRTLPDGLLWRPAVKRLKTAPPEVDISIEIAEQHGCNGHRVCKFFEPMQIGGSRRMGFDTCRFFYPFLRPRSRDALCCCASGFRVPASSLCL